MIALIPIVSFLLGVIVGGVLGVVSYRRQLFNNLDQLGIRRNK